MSKLIYLYAIFLFFIVIFSYLFVDNNLIYLKFLQTNFANNNRLLTASVFTVIIFLFFSFYYFFIKLAKKRAINLKLLIIITSCILFFSYPAMLSYDIFNYVTTSKVLFGYHENPYIIMPMQFVGEPYLQFTRATNKIALYGPFWLLLSGLPYLLGFGNFLLILFGFKIIALIFYIATSFLILKITKNKLSLALFALNPLVITETLISSHNDIVMMFFAVLSLYLLSQKEKIKSTILIFLSILIKYATAFLIPVFVYQLFKILKNKQVNLEKIYFGSAISMLIIFLLSSFREELYPWYGIWFLIFISIIPNRRFFLFVSLGFSLGLSLSYIPYMLLGTYFGITPYLKYLLVFIPVAISLALALRKRLWLKSFSLQ